MGTKICAAYTPSTGAGEGNRTLVISLENFCSTIELHPQCPQTIKAPPTQRPLQAVATTPANQNHPLNCKAMPSTLVEGEGFEPSKAEPSDLQSDPFDRSGTPPNRTRDYANHRIRCQTKSAFYVISGKKRVIRSFGLGEPLIHRIRSPRRLYSGVIRRPRWEEPPRRSGWHSANYAIALIY